MLDELYRRSRNPAAEIGRSLRRKSLPLPLSKKEVRPYGRLDQSGLAWAVGTKDGAYLLNVVR